MLEWLAQAIAKHTLGYATRCYRNRLKISLVTHIEQSWSDRVILISITSHGNALIIVDSWTVHIPLEELLPGVSKRDDKAEPPRPKRIGSIRRSAGRISRLLYKGSHIANRNEHSRLMACSILDEPHGRHQLLDPGARQRIEAGESAVRTFPRTSAIRQPGTIASNTQHLTIIPSRHFVGHHAEYGACPATSSEVPSQWQPNSRHRASTTIIREVGSTRYFTRSALPLRGQPPKG